MRLTEMKKHYPLPWSHSTNGRAMSAVVASNGRVVCGSLICQQVRPAASRQSHAFIVEAANAKISHPENARHSTRA
jgi:hypothetical protein